MIIRAITLSLALLGGLTSSGFAGENAKCPCEKSDEKCTCSKDGCKKCDCCQKDHKDHKH